MDGILRGKFLSNLTESLGGQSTIRAFQETDRFINRNAFLVNREMRSSLPMAAGTVWVDLRLDNVGGLLVLTIALMCTLGAKKLTPNAVALCLNYMIGITNMLSGTVSLATSIEQSSE